MDIIYLSGLVDTTSDGKEFSFDESSIDCIIEGLNNWIIGNMDIIQIRYSLVVILGLINVSGVQYKDMMIDG